jgi:hypothetical protein
MTDHEILKRLGLSEADAEDLTQRVTGLDASRTGTLQGVTSDAQEAAKAIGGNCSPEDLQRFLDARKGKCPGSAQIYFTPQGDPD